MLDSKERKQQRLESGLPDVLSAHIYNLLLGGCVLYGLIINSLIVLNFSTYFSSFHPAVLIIGYFICCLIGIFITRSENPIASFIGYNLVVIPIGAVLSVCLPAYAAEDISLAIILTTAVVAVMLALSTVFPRLFAGMGRTLFVTLLISTIAEIIALLMGYAPSFFNWLFVIIFTLYIGYDWHKAQMYPKTIDNAIDSALDIYLDIINLFLRILQIISKSKRRK